MSSEKPSSPEVAVTGLASASTIFKEFIALLWKADFKAAQCLVNCSSFHVSLHPKEGPAPGEYEEGYYVRFFTPGNLHQGLREMFGYVPIDEDLHDEVREHRKAAKAALEQVLPPGPPIHSIQIRRELQTRSQPEVESLIELLGTAGINNQASDLAAARAKSWENFRFRSQSEVQIARALDKAGVLFLPNCKARLGDQKARKNKEADFLVCHNGKWGILEVDGEPFHPPTRTVHDHERDRLFKAHGVRVVEHFDSEACYNHPDLVVQKFLAILEKS